MTNLSFRIMPSPRELEEESKDYPDKIALS